MVLKGFNYFITNAGQAETYVVFASTDKQNGPSGIGAFTVEKEHQAAPSELSKRTSV
jgi:alkylation response protein AidB-like acyl-CoA dehydrogenase